jgi:hypothetical protein
VEAVEIINAQEIYNKIAEDATVKEEIKKIGGYGELSKMGIKVYEFTDRQERSRS